MLNLARLGWPREHLGRRVLLAFMRAPFAMLALAAVQGLARLDGWRIARATLIFIGAAFFVSYWVGYWNAFPVIP